VNRRREAEGIEPVDLTTLAFDDPGAYQILKDGNTVAIFQVESDGMKKLLRKLQPIASRTSSRCSRSTARAARLRHGRRLHPQEARAAEDRLLPSETAGMPRAHLRRHRLPGTGDADRAGHRGYTLGGADLLRRAMGKKKASEMALQRQIFMDGAKAQGQEPALAVQLFDLMEKFAEYGFNKSHTAAYAVVTYQTAWLKAHYPSEFMAATLSSDMDDTDKVHLFVRDAQANGVTVLLPDINRSAFRFEPQDPTTIRFGLGAIKGAGQSAVENLIAVRESGGPFSDLMNSATG
jgi:DNA polymerase-3 subunit alpha